jgi:penicillin-binding protein 2
VTYSSSSPYHHVTPRGRRQNRSFWPKVVVLALLSVAAVVGGVALGRGESPSEWFDRSSPREESPAQVSQTLPVDDADENEQPASNVIEISSDRETESSNSSSDTVVNPQSQQAASDTGGGGASGQPAAAQSDSDSDQNAEESGSPIDAVTAFAERWVDGDYDGLYDLLTEESQESVARQEFIDRYTGIAEEAGLTSVAVTLSGEANLDTQVPIHVKLESSRVGTIEQDNVVQTRREGGDWKIEWTPSLIIAGLDEDCIDYTEEGAHRGSILDRDGEPLAYEGIVNEIGIIPGQLTDENKTVDALSKLIDMTPSDIKDRYKDGEEGWFMPITQLPDPLDTDILNGISEMNGVAVREQTSRIYPFGKVAAHITGYVTPVNAEDIEADPEAGLVAGEMIGRAGVEAAANDLLSGKPGGRLSIVDCSSRAEREVLAKRDPVVPKDLILTIDIDFQKEVDRALGDVTGSAVVLDPTTGAVMAMVSHPTFDPNMFIKGLTEREAATVFDENRRPLINRATQQGYPTGSIFKVITMSAAMAHLGYEGGSEIYCPTEWTIPGTDVVRRDWTYEYQTGDQGMLTLHTALVNSCNTVFYELGYELDDADQELLPNMAMAYGLGAPTGIPYLNEIAGVVPDPEWKIETIDDYWAIGDAVNLAIGQGYLEATPLQMANVYTAIANGGDLLQPYIVDQTQQGDVTTQVGKRTVIRHLPLEDWMVEELQSALRDQTSNSWGAGSASVFGDFGWPIAGKTGTAQNQSNKAQKPHSWYAAFGPYGETAEISSIVMVESSGEGVTFAAPRTKEIYQYWLENGFG